MSLGNNIEFAIVGGVKIGTRLRADRMLGDIQPLQDWWNTCELLLFAGPHLSVSQVVEYTQSLFALGAAEPWF